MRLNFKPTESLRGETLFASRHAWLKLFAVLAISLSVILLATRGWQRSASAQGSPEAIASVNAEDELNSTNFLPGDLDLTFGADGTVTTDLGNNLNDSAHAVAVQADNRIVAVGSVSTNSAGKDFAVIRLNPNGVLDTTFNDDGKLSFNFNSATRDDIARAVAVQPDGKIVIAGEADVAGFGNFDLALARLNADGTFDTSFGNNGKATTNLPNNRADLGRALVLQPDGKILVAGYSNRPTTGDDFIVVRYNPNGSLDTTFDGDGIATTDILTNREDRASSVVLQVDGRIIVAGHTNDPTFKNNFAVVRYNANGSLDSSFNGTGKVNTDLNLNSDDFGNAVTLQSDDKIVVAGQSAGDMGLVRYHSDGALDVTFGGGDGVITTNFGSGAADTARGVVAHPDGKITVAGRSRTELALARYNSGGTLDTSFDKDGLLVQNAGNNQLSPFGGCWGIVLLNDGKIIVAGEGWRDFSGIDFTVSRLTANGAFDHSFGGGDGIAATDISGRNDEARSVALQADGKIVVAGSALNSTGGSDFAVLRYNPNGTPDTSFDGDGIVITDISGHPEDNGFAVAVQPDGKILVAGYTDNAADGNVDDGALIRYNSNGTLDASFGNGGVAILTGAYVTRGGLAWIQNRSIALQPNGKIVIAGEAHYFSAFSDGFVARYNANGTLDAAFGNTIIDGVPVPGIAVFSAAALDTFSAVAVQPDGKVVAAGWVNEGPAGNLYLARLTSAGALDTSFDGDGKLTTDFGNGTFDAARDVKIQPDGKIIAVGETHINFIDFAAARYNTDGSLDTSFGGGDGMLNIDFNGWGEGCSAVSLLPDGRMVLAGAGDLSRNFSGFAVVRLTPNGAFDTSFGGGSGRVITTLGEGVNTGLGQAVNDMALQADGKIVLVGSSNFNSTGRDFVAVRYLSESLTCDYTLSPTAASFPVAGGNGSINVATSAGCEWTAASGDSWISITSSAAGNGSGTVNYSVAANAGAGRVGTVTVAGQTFTVTQSSPLPTLQFSQPNYSGGESGGLVTLTVTRSGGSSAPASVDYRTQDADTFTVGCADAVNNHGAAYARCDFATVVGILNFAVGETAKTISVPLIDDSHAEGAETFQVRLSNASGALLAPADAATVTITDNDAAGATNPVTASPQFFVRQQYLDFLSREPDAAGFNAWLGVLNTCANIFTGPNVASGCDRIFVSGEGFFRSQEFQLKGSYVFRFYKVAFNRLPEYPEVVSDMSFVAGQTAEEVFARKAQLAALFTDRAEFKTAYGGMTNAQYVAALMGRYGLTQITTPDPAQPDGTAKVTLTSTQLTGRLDAATLTRAQVLRAVADSDEVGAREFNNAFVGMQYYGYLRRKPDDAGFRAWLGVLQSGDVRTMVNGFLNSPEYQLRFGQP